MDRVALFIKLSALKCYHLVNLSTAMKMYKALNNLILRCFQKLFELWEKACLSKVSVRTNTNKICMSDKAANFSSCDEKE